MGIYKIDRKEFDLELKEQEVIDLNQLNKAVEEIINSLLQTEENGWNKLVVVEAKAVIGHHEHNRSAHPVTTLN